MMVDRLMSTAPAAGGSVEAGPRQRPRRQRDRHDVVAGGPGQVLHHLAVAGPGEPDHRADASGVAGGEHDTGRLERHIGAGADGQADVGAGERRRVVDAVADHRHGQTSILQLGDRAVLVLGQDLGEHLVDPELPPDVVGHGARVARDHHDVVDAQAVEVGDGLGRLRTDLVLQGERPDDLPLADEVEHGRALGRPGLDGLAELVGHARGRAGGAVPARPPHTGCRRRRPPRRGP